MLKTPPGITGEALLLCERRLASEQESHYALRNCSDHILMHAE